MQSNAVKAKRSPAVCVVRLLLSLALVAAAGQGGGFRLLIQHIETLGPRQWLGLVAVSFIPAAPALVTLTQRLAGNASRKPVSPSAESPVEAS